MQRQITNLKTSAKRFSAIASLILTFTVLSTSHTQAQSLSIHQGFDEGSIVLAQATTKSAAEIAADIRASQKLLAELGYFRGRADGKESDALTRAVRAFQKDRDLKVTGKAGARLVKSLETAKKDIELQQKRTLVVEKMLKQLGYAPGRQDGVQDASLTNAIKKFQKDRNSKAKKKGVVNGTVIRSLRVALETEGKTPPREAYTLSSKSGTTPSKSKSSTKKKSSSKSKSTSGSKTAKSTASDDGCGKGKEKVGSKCLKECKTGYTRDTKSNRCKKDSKASSKSSSSSSSSKSTSTEACPKGKEKVGSKCLTKCKSGSERDSKTNRCKKVSSKAKSTSSSSKTTAKCKSGTEKVGSKCLKKCKSGYKRDSKTNRCKKK